MEQKVWVHVGREHRGPLQCVSSSGMCLLLLHLGDSKELFNQMLRTELFGENGDTVFSYGAPPSLSNNNNSVPTTPCSVSSSSTPRGSEPSLSQSTDGGDLCMLLGTPPRPSPTGGPKQIGSPGYLPRRLDYPVSPSRSPGNLESKGRQRYARLIVPCSRRPTSSRLHATINIPLASGKFQRAHVAYWMHLVWWMTSTWIWCVCL